MILRRALIMGIFISALVFSGVARGEEDFMLLPAVETEATGLKQDGKIKLGDELYILLKTKEIKPAQVAFQLAQPSKPAEGETKPQNVWALDSQVKTVQETGEIYFSVVALKPGQNTLPGLVLKDAQGKAIARSLPLQLVIESAIKKDDQKPNEPVELMPPVSLVFPVWMVFLLGLLAILLIAGVLYGLMEWSKRRKKLLPAAPPKPELPEDQTALNSLMDIERQGWMKAGRFKAHYFAVSETLKRYIGARYLFEAAESTTYEVMQHLEKAQILSSTELDKLESLMSRMDVVKFTDSIPSEPDGKTILEEARKFILTTRRPPVVAILAEKQNALQ